MKPYSKTYSKQSIGLGDIYAVIKTLVSPYLTNGPAIEKVENEIAEYVGAKYCIMVSNGTAGLNLLAKMLPKSRVHVPDITFMATANAFDLEGHDVVLEDVEEDKPFLPKKNYLKLPFTDNKDNTIVIPVHMMGHPVINLDRYGDVTIIEDACHALGASYYDTEGKQMVGNCKYSLATVFSFHPVKPITSGEGGAITTNDEALYDELKSLRSHGISITIDGKYELETPSLNFRMTDIQASLLSSQLKKLDKFTEKRTELAEEYSKILPRSVIPTHLCTERPSWHLYSIRVSQYRDELRYFLKNRGIATQIHYQPLHTLKYYHDKLDSNNRYPNANKYHKETLSLPLYPSMSKKDVKHIANKVLEFWQL